MRVNHYMTGALVALFVHRNYDQRVGTTKFARREIQYWRTLENG
ncbi:MAG: hypothetical protein WKF84_06920 [Pyrinomonadaceae bacterium]